MKKKIFTILILVGLFAMPAIGFAETLETYDVVDTLENIVDWIYTIVLIAAGMYIILGGFTYITAEGDPTKLEKAKKQVIFALFGLVIVLLAGGLKEFMISMMQ